MPQSGISAVLATFAASRVFSPNIGYGRPGGRYVDHLCGPHMDLLAPARAEARASAQDLQVPVRGGLLRWHEHPLDAHASTLLGQ